MDEPGETMQAQTGKHATPGDLPDIDVWEMIDYMCGPHGDMKNLREVLQMSFGEMGGLEYTTSMLHIYLEAECEMHMGSFAFPTGCKVHISSEPNKMAKVWGYFQVPHGSVLKLSHVVLMGEIGSSAKDVPRRRHAHGGSEPVALAASAGSLVLDHCMIKNYGEGAIRLTHNSSCKMSHCRLIGFPHDAAVMVEPVAIQLSRSKLEIRESDIKRYKVGISASEGSSVLCSDVAISETLNCSIAALDAATTVKVVKCGAINAGAGVGIAAANGASVEVDSSVIRVLGPSSSRKIGGKALSVSGGATIRATLSTLSGKNGLASGVHAVGGQMSLKDCKLTGAVVDAKSGSVFVETCTFLDVGSATRQASNAGDKTSDAAAAAAAADVRNFCRPLIAASGDVSMELKDSSLKSICPCCPVIRCVSGGRLALEGCQISKQCCGPLPTAIRAALVVGGVLWARR